VIFSVIFPAPVAAVSAAISELNEYCIVLYGFSLPIFALLRRGRCYWP